MPSSGNINTSSIRGAAVVETASTVVSVVRIWVAVLHVSDAVARKIMHVHELDPQDVRDALVAIRGLPVRRDVHPERGERYLIKTEVGGERCLIVLYPTDTSDPDEWNLGSAYPLDRS